VFLLLDSWACVLLWALLLFGGSDSPNIPVTPVRGAKATAVNKFGGRRRPREFSCYYVSKSCWKSTNQPGHSAGGTRAGAGRKAANSAPLGTAAPSSIQASRSTSRLTGTDPQINLQSKFIYLFILHLIDICNTQPLSMGVQLEPLALRIGSIQCLVCFSVCFLGNILISLN
jgi:hypothetical protein